MAALLRVEGPDSLVSATRRLRGNYVASIRDTTSGRHVVFTDPGGMLHAFVAEQGTSTTRLQLAEAAGATFADIDAAAAGRVGKLRIRPWGRAVLSSIRQLRSGTA